MTHLLFESSSAAHSSTVARASLPSYKALNPAAIDPLLCGDIAFSMMTLGDALVSIWQQVLAEGKTTVELEGRAYPVGSTRVKKLRTVRFEYSDYRLDGIEQNPQTTSRWAALAREGKRVMQYSFQQRYVANVCEGKLTRYPAWHALHLPE